ncbi:activator-dependent family glycosyltransferase [Solwaraspora sp. WMMD1047]|uniref:activator-dependent family glycosyltransferase n=1 Tax=Solwaraspora sp. WMMD1047 TaxID=3016102 RepID=UPI0024172C36|nr:activator-dependent family glycosyltransferase [Solwaraspora sp. WMMD1047]MDG4827802.1 activator-dependent family glycosyltransferase [Solwaraspora sp. WMMD1047]
MRVLFATYAEKTHFFLMAPLAWAMQTAGHEVRVASQPEMTDVITRAGLTAVPVGKDHSFFRVMRTYPIFDPRRDRVPPFGIAELPPEELTWEYLAWGYEQIVPWWFRLINDSMVDDLVTLCRTWKPDLVIWDQTTFAASIAATASGAVHARLMWSVDLFARMRSHFLRLGADRPSDDRADALARWLGASVGRYGGTFAEEMTSGHFTIDFFPDSLRLDPDLDLNLDLHYLPMRYVPYNGVSVVPPWLRVPPERPRVCLTLGTAATERFDGYSVPVGELLESIAELDIEVVATLPQRQQEELGPVPENVRLVTYVPLHALAPTCSAVINHGGGGSYSTTVLAGIPQLVLYNFLDAPVRARHLVKQGAGLAMHTSEVTGERVRDAVARLVGEPSFAAGAGRLRAELLALPTPNQLVGELERLTETYRAGAQVPVG